MKRIIPLLREYLKETILAPSFKLLEALMDLFVPLVVAALINNGINGMAAGSRSYIVRQVMVMILLAALGLVFSFTAQYFAAKASVGAATKLRQNLFDHIQRLSFSELDTIGTSTLITRMTSDVNQVQTGLNMALRLLLRSPFIVFGSMIMAFTIDVRCAMVFVVAIPILSVVVYGIMIITIPLYKKVQEGLDRVLSATRENLTGVRVIRAFCKEESEIAEFDERSEALTKLNEYVGRISALMNPATYLLINIATVILIREGAIRVNMGGIRQGDVVALYNYMAQMIVELVKLASLIITINRAVASAERVSGILDVEPGMKYPSASPSAAAIEPAMSEAATKKIIRFDHVRFAYSQSGADALEDISFCVKPGQTVGIIGATGSGKSTLVNLIPRFYDVTEGKVEVFGRDVRSYPEGELISQIGVIPQRAVLFQGTIRENLLWGNEHATDQELWEALRVAQAAEIVEGKPGGLDSEIEQGGRNLSGGQRQRLTIARALVRNPKILIMDDSASALDFATDAALRKAVADFSDQGMTTLIISQRTSSVRNADLILVLEDGQLVGCADHGTLMRSCPVYQEIYYSQYPEEKPADKPGKIHENAPDNKSGHMPENTPAKLPAKDDDNERRARS